MARSNHNPSQNNDDHRKFNAKRRKIEPPRTAPETERGLTHSPYFNGMLYQRMMKMKERPASGRASALRADHTPTTIFKTRFQPCRIAVRAADENPVISRVKQLRFFDHSVMMTPAVSQILSLDRKRQRSTQHGTRKTDDSRRSCDFLFPGATGRWQVTGLLEQMPRASA